MAKRRNKSTPELDLKRALAYIRISPGERKSSRTGKNDDAAGRDAQINDIQQWAARNNVVVVQTFEDIGICGETKDVDSPLSDRPGLLAAIASLQTLNCGVLVVQKGDRLARDTMLAPMVRRIVQREGAEVVNANGLGNGDSAEAMIVRTIDDMLNALELIRIRQRTKAALAVKQLRGERVGKIRFGYRLKPDGLHRVMRDSEAKHNPACKGCVHLEPDPGEQASIVRILELASKKFTVRQIVDILNEEKQACRGKSWSVSTVWRVIHKTTEN